MPIRIVQLPTYASWCNRIEKLWRKLKQERLHVHPWADHPPTWRAQITAFFQQFASGSPDLLHYVGLHLPCCQHRFYFDLLQRQKRRQGTALDEKQKTVQGRARLS